jgi:hypothetical protein
MPGETYHRCRHCRGFYEASRPGCKWCKYDAPFLDTAGKPRHFPDRETCRALQLAEYEQLPKEAYDDCMGPPPNDLTLLCNCLHCGPDGHTFEAIEMRWMPNEQMWACPCTTCGGRGFAFDIHSAENKWRCDECGHFYLPPNNDYHAENAKCPKCGGEQASGWFEDDYNEEDFEEFETGLDNITPRPADSLPASQLDDQIPWDDPFESELENEYDLGISWQESEDDEEPFNGQERIPDDIDNPFKREERDIDINEDDIPF